MSGAKDQSRKGKDFDQNGKTEGEAIKTPVGAIPLRPNRRPYLLRYWKWIRKNISINKDFILLGAQGIGKALSFSYFLFLFFCLECFFLRFTSEL
jgi:hypothetical protein